MADWRGNNPGEQTIVDYCDASERGVYSLAFGLGRSRAAVPADLESPPLGLNDFSLSPLQQTYANWNAAIEPAGDNHIRLILTMSDDTNVQHFTIDSARHVLLKHEVFSDGKLTNSTTFNEFVEVAGTWWACRIVQTNDLGQQLSDLQLQIKRLSSDEYAQQLQLLLADKSMVQLIQQPFRDAQGCRQKVVDGTGDFDDRLAMILYNAQIQQWDEMWKHVDAAEKLASDKPGVRWFRHSPAGHDSPQRRSPSAVD